MPFGHTPTTLISLRNFAPIFFMWPSRNPCDRPSVAPDFIARWMFSNSCVIAASEMRHSTRSELRTMSSISPAVPLSVVKPTLAASANDLLFLRSPMTTLMPRRSSESRRFCACAGPCELHPRTAVCLTPLRASARSGNLSRPPTTTSSVVRASLIDFVPNTLVRLGFMAMSPRLVKFHSEGQSIPTNPREPYNIDVRGAIVGNPEEGGSFDFCPKTCYCGEYESPVEDLSKARQVDRKAVFDARARVRLRQQVHQDAPESDQMH